MKNNITVLIIIILCVTTVVFGYLYMNESKRVKNLKDSHDSLELKNQELNLKIDTLSREKDELQINVAEAAKSKEIFEKLNNKLTERLDTIKSEKELLIEQLKSLTSRGMGEKAKELEPQKSLAKALKEKAALEIELGRLKSILSQKEEEMNRIEKSKLGILARLDEFNKFKAELEEKLKTEGDISSILAEDLAKEKKGKDVIVEEIDKTKLVLQDKIARINQAKKELADIVEKTRQDIKSQLEAIELEKVIVTPGGKE